MWSCARVRVLVCLLGVVAFCGWVIQFYQAEFQALQAQHGVGLENLVYYRSSGSFADAATHYFVMTTSADALHTYGALRNAPADCEGGPEQVCARVPTPSPSPCFALLSPPLPSPCLPSFRLVFPASPQPRRRALTHREQVCAAANVDTAKLEEYARAAVGAFVPSLAQHPLCPGQLSLFDFSERKQSNRAAALVTGASVGSKQDTPCIVARVGYASKPRQRGHKPPKAAKAAALSLSLSPSLSCPPPPLLYPSAALSHLLPSLPRPPQQRVPYL